MPLIEKKLQMGGIPSREFIEYFIELGCWMDEHGEVKLLAPEWQVTLKEKEEQLGSIKIERVEVTFKGEETVIDEVISAFRRMFMRAGG